MTVEQLLRIL